MNDECPMTNGRSANPLQPTPGWMKEFLSACHAGDIHQGTEGSEEFCPVPPAAPPNQRFTSRQFGQSFQTKNVN
jgi:hypothetical protein